MKVTMGKVIEYEKEKSHGMGNEITSWNFAPEFCHV